MTDNLNFATEVLAVIAALFAGVAVQNVMNARTARLERAAHAGDEITFDDDEIVPLTVAPADAATVALKAMLAAFQPSDRYDHSPDQWDALRLAAAAIAKTGGAA